MGFPFQDDEIPVIAVLLNELSGEYFRKIRFRPTLGKMIAANSQDDPRFLVRNLRLILEVEYPLNDDEISKIAANLDKVPQAALALDKLAVLPKLKPRIRTTLTRISAASPNEYNRSLVRRSNPISIGLIN